MPGGASKLLFASGDSGQTFQETANPIPPLGSTAEVAEAHHADIVVASGTTASLLYVSFHDGDQWRTALHSNSPAHTWKDLDFPSSEVGVVIEGTAPASAPAHLWMTSDGGGSWTAISF